MDCQRANEEIKSASLQDPSQELDVEVRQHLEACPECRQEFQDQQDAWSLLAAALPQAAASQELEERLMARVHAAPQPIARFSRRAIILKYALAASILFLLVGGTIFRLDFLAQNQPTVTDADLDRIREIAAQTGKIEELQRVFATPDLKYVSLDSNPIVSVTCYLIHDPFSNQVHVFARNLDSATANLHIWLLDETEQVLNSAALVTADRVGSAVLTVDDTTEVAAAIVTIEPSKPTTDQPSSDVLFRADVVGL